MGDHFHPAVYSTHPSDFVSSGDSAGSLGAALAEAAAGTLSAQPAGLPREEAAAAHALLAWLREGVEAPWEAGLPVLPPPPHDSEGVAGLLAAESGSIAARAAMDELMRRARVLGRGVHGTVWALGEEAPELVLKHMEVAPPAHVVREVLGAAVAGLAVAAGATVAAPWLHHAVVLGEDQFTSTIRQAARLQHVDALTLAVAALDPQLRQELPHARTVPPEATAAAVHQLAQRQVNDLLPGLLPWKPPVLQLDATPPPLRRALQRDHAALAAASEWMQEAGVVGADKPRGPLARAAEEEDAKPMELVVLQQRLPGRTLEAAVAALGSAASQTTLGELRSAADALVMQQLAALHALHASTGWTHNDEHMRNALVTPPQCAGMDRVVADFPPLAAEPGLAAALEGAEGVPPGLPSAALRLTIDVAAAGGLVRIIDFGLAEPVARDWGAKRGLETLGRLQETLRAASSLTNGGLLLEKYVEEARTWLDARHTEGSPPLWAALVVARTLLVRMVGHPLPGLRLEMFKDGILPPLPPAGSVRRVHTVAHVRGSPASTINEGALHALEAAWRRLRWAWTKRASATGRPGPSPVQVAALVTALSRHTRGAAGIHAAPAAVVGGVTRHALPLPRAGNSGAWQRHDDSGGGSGGGGGGGGNSRSGGGDNGGGEALPLVKRPTLRESPDPARDGPLPRSRPRPHALASEGRHGKQQAAARAARRAVLDPF